MSLLLAWLVPRVARKHRFVEAPGPGLTVVFLTWCLRKGGRAYPAVPGLHISTHCKLVPHPPPPACCLNADGRRSFSILIACLNHGSQADVRFHHLLRVLVVPPHRE